MTVKQISDDQGKKKIARCILEALPDWFGIPEAREEYISGSAGRSRVMQDFGFLEMQKIQAKLQEKYKDMWEPVCPETGGNKLLWLMTELGEVIDIIKKDGNERIMDDQNVRAHFIEEMADVLMYYNDVMLCYDISVDELREVYRAKHHKNMSRWD